MGFYVKSIYLNRELLKSKIYTNILNINVSIEKKKYIYKFKISVEARRLLKSIYTRHLEENIQIMIFGTVMIPLL